MNACGEERRPVVVRRTIAAAREELFGAWTKPERMKTWFHMAPDWATPRAASDARPGGAYAVDMRTADGHLLRYAGRYQIVDDPHRLEMTWPAFGRVDLPTVVRVDFSPASSGATEVTVTHHDLPDEEARTAHRAGWSSVLERLDAVFGEGPAGTAM